MLDKRECRRFADPGFSMPPDHGLLLAAQVAYIVRTDVKIVGHRRTLLLYVYDRERAARGDFTPVFTVFQASDDFVTLARRDDGRTAWRKAAFDDLIDHGFTGKCAFYAKRDEDRVRRYFRENEEGGFWALIQAQAAIQAVRSRTRQRRRERHTLARMEGIHALPRGLDGWIRREIMPAYFRCRHTSGRNPVAGTCTSCGKESVLPRVSHGDKIACPRCGRELTVRSAGKAGRHIDRDTVQTVEKIGDSEIVIRIVKVRYDYKRDRLMPETDVYENARIFLRAGPDGKAVTEPYYYHGGKGELTHWRPGKRPLFPYGENFESSTYGHVYCRNLAGMLEGTPWRYCPAETFYDHFREPMQLEPFLSAHLEHPRLEHLVKTGFFELASDLAYGRVRDGLLDEDQNRTHRVLRVSAGDVGFLRDLEINAAALSAFRECPECRDRQSLFLWRREHDVGHSMKQLLAYVAPRRLMNYADRQSRILAGRENGYGRPRYRDMQSVVSEYRDYLDMCAKLEYDMKDKSVLCPPDLQKAHDRVRIIVKIRHDARLRQEFETAMKAVSGRLAFESGGLKIVLPSEPEDLQAEGRALRHCVGTYADRVAEHECIIAFLRQCDCPDKPYYTIEVRDGKIAQVRGMGNCQPTPEVDAFMAQWVQQVLRAA